MNITAVTTKHLLILCCYGGTPFVDFHAGSNLKGKYQSMHSVDPTDWIAIDTAGSELNLSSVIIALPTLYIPSEIKLNACDLFNLTFTDTEDEALFENSKGEIKCR
ncbi:unnamed protein product [Thelazia callipaeda]|uniref:DOC domain-containing protein n=1 Tax=Thelazia callipaeda TaxID=103827 RepID=A0A0N5D6E4_THECL|nr:unnamed protein product [Thelazia callipaeda]